MVEILKQNQYIPMSIAHQISVIFAGVNGFMDDLEISQVSKFESDLVEYLNSNNQDLLDTITSTGKLDDDSKNNLKDTLANFVKTFNA